MKSCVVSKDAIPALSIFSHATISNGTVYVSGSIGCDKEYKLVGDLQAQVRAAIENMRTILRSAGTNLDHVVKVTAYLTNMERDFAPMNKIYAEYFPGNAPARTCIGVAALPLGAYFEIECICELP